MRLNTLKPAAGARKKKVRVARGIGSGLGKTAGRGHKGQRARAGGYHKVGFEGGQMPLQRRLPKFGFKSRMAAAVAEVRLSDLEKMDVKTVDLEALRKAGVIGPDIEKAKVILSGKLTKALALKGLAATKGARAAIEQAGGSIEA